MMGYYLTMVALVGIVGALWGARTPSATGR